MWWNAKQHPDYIEMICGYTWKLIKLTFFFPVVFLWLSMNNLFRDRRRRANANSLVCIYFQVRIVSIDIVLQSTRRVCTLNLEYSKKNAIHWKLYKIRNLQKCFKNFFAPVMSSQITNLILPQKTLWKWAKLWYVLRHLLKHIVVCILIATVEMEI